VGDAEQGQLRLDAAGNGDIGLNVWVEESGDVRPADRKDRRVGRKLVAAEARPGAAEAVAPCRSHRFARTLRLRTGDIEIQLGDVRLNVWVDANRSVIVIDAEGDAPFVDVGVAGDVAHRAARDREDADGRPVQEARQGRERPYPTITWPDHILPAKHSVVWCHHNERREHDGFEINMRLQGLGGFIDNMEHPLRGRTFGGMMSGEGFISRGNTTLVSEAPRTRHRLMIEIKASQSATIEEWRRRLVPPGRVRADRNEHEQTWRTFWNRSHLFVTTDSTEARDVTRGYVLQRFMNACAGRCGPIKFNGSIFSVGRGDDPDFRRWGGPGFWFQNMRLIYWPMIASGDFDLLGPFFDMYRDMLPLMTHRTRTYYGHGGAHFPETITFWGAEVSAHYGWTPFEQRPRPEAECSYVTYYWTSGIELSLLLWHYWSCMRDVVVARDHLVPIAKAVIAFFDLHYPRDEHGKLRIEPGQSLETWHEAVNATPDVAGLRDLIERLLCDTPPTVSDEHAASWRRLLDDLPPIPVGEKDGKPIILPGEHVARKTNKENPELYAVFPFRVFGLGKPDLERARNTFFARLHASHDCWSQDDIHAGVPRADGRREGVCRQKRAAPRRTATADSPASGTRSTTGYRTWTTAACSSSRFSRC
jgi:hypothetical protein